MNHRPELRNFGALARAAVVICCASLAFAVSAASPKDTPTPKGAKITAEQAAAIAVKTMPGKVTDVKVEKKKGKNVYAVEIQTEGQGEKDVLVDIVTGEVVGVD